MDIWQRLVAFWQRCGLEFQPGVEAAAVRTFEAKYGLTLPTDLRSYFEAANGTRYELELEAGYFRFWSLEEVKPVHEEFHELHPDRFAYPGYFHFADHSVWMNAYAVKLGQSSRQSGPVISVAGAADSGEKIADSFIEFIEKYLADPWSVFIPQGK